MSFRACGGSVSEKGSFVAAVPTQLGTFHVVYDGRTVQIVDLAEPGVPQVGIPMGARAQKPPFPAGSPPRQLKEYFQGRRTTFDLEVSPTVGTEFDRKVWAELLKIPTGETATYGEIARRIGYSGAARAVGGAVGRNPIPIVVPCHRVVGADQTLTGFGLGLWRKRWLLAHEGAWPLKSRSFEGPRRRGQRTLDHVHAESSARPPRSAAASTDPTLRPRVDG
jgi:methylated-DNA-[protein]-cysteine S-methyltransferase